MILLKDFRNQNDIAALILRFSVGFMMLFHGYKKASDGVGYIGSLFSKIGLPESLAYLSLIGMIIAPIMLLLGFKVRIASILVMGSMFVAIILAHTNDIFALNKYGAWAIETPMFYIFSSMAIFCLGAGKYSLDKK